MRNPVLVFDFDGVISNSTEECLITGYNAWNLYHKIDKKVKRVEEIPKSLVDYFRPRRAYVRTGGQYYAIFYSFFEKTSIESEADFNQICKIKSDDIKGFDKAFFNMRDWLRSGNLQEWIDLHGSYESVMSSVIEFFHTVECFIVTGKDKVSVLTILKSLGLEIDEERVFDKDAADNKLLALEKIAQLTDNKPENVYFIDDNVNHLIAPKEAGFSVYMADWGYHTQEHLNHAKQLKLPIVNLKNWDSILGKKLFQNIN